MPCRMFSSISGLYPLDASSTLPPSVVPTENVPRPCLITPLPWPWVWGQNDFLLPILKLACLFTVNGLSFDEIFNYNVVQFLILTFYG